MVVAGNEDAAGNEDDVPGYAGALFGGVWREIGCVQLGNTDAVPVSGSAAAPVE